jgi:hypothetical protein
MPVMPFVTQSLRKLAKSEALQVKRSGWDRPSEGGAFDQHAIRSARHLINTALISTPRRHPQARRGHLAVITPNKHFEAGATKIVNVRIKQATTYFGFHPKRCVLLIADSGPNLCSVRICNLWNGMGNQFCTGKAQGGPNQQKSEFALILANGLILE